MISDLTLSGSEATAAIAPGADTEKTIPPIPSSFSSLPSVTLLFAVPTADTSFHRLGPELCQETWLTLARLKQVHFAKNKTREAERIAAGLQRLGNKRGCAAANILDVYYNYTRYGKKVGDIQYPAGAWQCVVNWAKAGPRARATDADSDTVALPDKFISDCWHRLCDKHQRVTSEARRELLQIWKTGFDEDRKQWKQIPGYAEWPKADPRTGVPCGWGERNLYRYAPDRFERKAARVGIQAASCLGLKLRSSRVGLKLLEQVQFDDHEFDAKTMFPGQLKSWRPRCLGSADVLTSFFDIVAKPTFWDADEGAKKTLNETDAMWFIVRQLTHVGFRTDETGTSFYVEHGTMAIRGNKVLKLGDLLRDDFENRIFLATGGKVIVRRPGRFHKPAHGGQFAAPSGGNFRFKALIELLWRLINDRLDSIPGQVGKDRLHAPEELERADAYVAKLLKFSAAMNPEEAARLILPRFIWGEFVEYAHEKVFAINAERQHEIEGWDRCGFFAREFRSSPDALDWHPIAHLPEIFPAPEGDSSALQLAAQNVARITSDDRCNRVRRLARMEVFQPLYEHELKAGLITRLSPTMIPTLVGQRHALKCNGHPYHTVRNGVVSIDDWRISPDPVVFIAQKESGERFREGERFVCYLNPMAPDCLVACNERHQPLAVFHEMPNPAKNDDKALRAAMGLQRSWYARALAPMRERNEPDAAALEFMRRHNAAILDGGKTEAEKARSKTLQRAALPADALLDSDARPAEHCPERVAPEKPIEDRRASFDPSELL